ncbi:MAG: hypothetical protein KKA81_01560 [Bacteroidetes bacterium]|nr:hypothetical protein [Bacteroidota bacterium]
MERRGPYRLTEVNDKTSRKAFLKLPVSLYKSDRQWSRPIDSDIEKIFDPGFNKKFRKGNAIRWILEDRNGVVAGRVAAFYDDNSFKQKHPTGGMGFFDCINDKEAAEMLFDACKNWLGSHGMEAMDGPVNFGERDTFWGCLVEGFTEPLYNMPYNYPYYQRFFEDYGFELYFRQFTYHRKIEPEGMADIVIEKGRRILSNPDYSFEMIRKNNFEKYANDFLEIYNQAWGRFPGVSKMKKFQAMALMKEIKPIADERLIYFGYHQGEPIAFFIMLPDISQILKKFHGKFHLINKLRLLYLLKVRKKVTRIMGKIFGVIPRFQGKGVEAGLVLAFEKEAFKPGFHYTDLEMNWIGDFNPTMIKNVEQIGGKIYKIHHTYRYMFDRSIPVERMRKLP